MSCGMSAANLNLTRLDLLGPLRQHYPVRSY